MIIQAFPCPPYATNAYVVVCPKQKRAIVIDPAPHSRRLLVDFLKENQFQLDGIYLTHSHWDHIADAAALLVDYPVPIKVHPKDRGNLENPGSDGLPLRVAVGAVMGALPLEEGDLVTVGDLTFHVIHTPGHSPGGVCFFCAEEKILFSGDTLFKGSIGNMSLPTACADDMWSSLRKLSLLPGQTKVYPGHGSATTIQNEHWLPRAEEIFGSF